MDHRTRGQLFIIDGDLGALRCDAVLIPVDRHLIVTDTWVDVLGLKQSGPLEGHSRFPDGTRVMRYEGAQTLDGPELWLGHIGAGNAPESWYAAGLVEFVERISSGEILEERAVPKRVAVNVAGSGFGGSGDDKGRLFRTIVPALHQAAQANDVDVVLVCWGDRQYSAAQRARLDLDDDSYDQDSGTMSEVARLAGLARRRELVLFVGAGVSMGAGLSSWAGLIRAMMGAAKASDFDTERFWRLDVRDQAALVGGRFDSVDEYRAALSLQVQGTNQYSLAHGLLASLGAREHITTNYDALFEQALRAGERECAVMPYEPVTSQSRWLLKLHGSVDEPDDMVLTRDDYLGLTERSGALFGVLQAMLMTRHLLFIGYSLADESFHQVMHEIRRAQRGVARKVGTALLLYPDPLIEELWGDMLDFVAIATEPSKEDGEPSVAVAAREHDIFLNQLCLESANVSSFLLDPTYESMLTREESELATALRGASAIVGSGSSPISAVVQEFLGNLGTGGKSWR